MAASPLAFKMPYFGSVVKRNSRSGSRAQVRTTRRIAKNRFLPVQRGMVDMGPYFGWYSEQRSLGGLWRDRMFDSG
jgi:hypothetical protein